MNKFNSLLLALPIAFALFVAPQSAAHATTKPSLAIGDSVMLGAKNALKKVGVTRVDAAVGRQSEDVGDLLTTFGQTIPKNVIVNLGANGPFTLYHCRQILEALGTQRHLYLVTVKVPRTWEGQSNTAIHGCASTYRERVTLIDWNLVAKKHPAWFGKDEFHLDSVGAAAYAKLIASALNSRM